jgi:hypothetical protein
LPILPARPSRYDGWCRKENPTPPDGTQIVFDRFHENSDIVLIDLPAATSDEPR